MILYKVIRLRFSEALVVDLWKFCEKTGRQIWKTTFFFKDLVVQCLAAGFGLKNL
jgi:hypothetical protein